MLPCFVPACYQVSLKKALDCYPFSIQFAGSSAPYLLLLNNVPG
jgi:hypothetical protein